MSLGGEGGDKQERKYRRALILIYSVLCNIAVQRARQEAMQAPSSQLHARLLLVVKAALAVKGATTLRPIATQLISNPALFLVNQRIKTSAGMMTASGPTQYDLYFDGHYNLYTLEPSHPTQAHVHSKVDGYNIHVQSYSSVKDQLHAIDGSTVTGNLAVTTQLSGCAVIYRVNGGSLTMAHIRPDDKVRHLLPQDLAQYAGSPSGVALTQRIVRDGNLAGAAAGTLGVFGMVAGTGSTALSLAGARRVRTHGYTDQWGNAYFIGVKVNGNWQLFGQQNNPRNANDGVSNMMQLYP
ncbi:hypothetical protein CKY51_22040 [Xanthomonas maliensis]|nr:hypothetical protein CKY51_22040 [Xanthomonas maliensis]